MPCTKRRRAQSLRRCEGSGPVTRIIMIEEGEQRGHDVMISTKLILHGHNRKLTVQAI